MSFSFVVEEGFADPDANAYCDTEFADDYIEANTHASADWLALSEDVKERLLVRASKIIDVRFKWQGQRIDQDSGLKWPRSGVYDEDGFLIGEDVIPKILKEAVAEFAVYLLGEDWTAPRENDQYRELQVDVIDVKFNTDYRRSYVPDTIVAMLKDLGYAQTGARPAFKKIKRA